MAFKESRVPEELRYLIPLALRHGDDARVHEFDDEQQRHVSYAEKLDSSSIAELGDLYLQIKFNGHATMINEWHSKSWKKLRDEAWPIYGLMFLFAELGELGYQPFDDGSVRPTE